MWLHHEIKTLGDIPRHYARVSPRQPALISPAGSLSFAELDDRSNRVANALIKLGIAQGDHVALLGKNSTRYFDILFGVNKAGAALLTLNWRLAAPELAAVVRDASPVAIIADREYEDVAEIVRTASERKCRKIVFDSSREGAAELDGLMEASDSSDPAVPVDPRQTAILMYTSGTTGNPKGVQQTHQGHLYTRLCEHLDQAIVYQPGDMMLTVMPLFHAMGLGLSLQALYNGATVAVYPMPDPGELMQLIARHRPTILPIVPTVIQMMLDHPSAPAADFSSLRILLYAGAPISLDLLNQAMAVMKCDFIQFYGATETTVEVTFLRAEQHRPSSGQEKLKSCGTPLPLMDIKVVDIWGIEIPNGQVGELAIRSPALSSGYYNQPELTAATFKNGWYHSGDAGYRDSDGYFYIVDRIKDMVISGGENVYSIEVEHALTQHPNIAMCAVFGLPDAKWGERVVAAIVPGDQTSLSKDDVLAHCRKLIAGYKVPKQIEFLRALPMTTTGKIAKSTLRKQFS